MHVYLCNKCNARDADSIPCKLTVYDPDLDPGFCPFTVMRNNATVAEWTLKKNRNILSDLLYSIASFLFRIAK